MHFTQLCTYCCLSIAIVASSVFGDSKELKSAENDNEGKNGSSSSTTTEISRPSTSTTTPTSTTTEIQISIPIESKDDEFRRKRNFQQRILHEPSFHEYGPPPGHRDREYDDEQPRHRGSRGRPRSHHHQFHPEDAETEIDEPGLHPGPPPPGFGSHDHELRHHGPPPGHGRGHGQRTPLEGKDKENIMAAQATMNLYYDDLIQLQNLMSNMLTTEDESPPGPQYSSQLHDDYDY